jgi:predicted MFS family arabinose efflux permease
MGNSNTKQGFWSYENKMLGILCLTFGFVMFDRFALTNMANFVVEDLGLTNAQLGLLTSAFAFAWAISGFFGSAFSDLRSSKKKVLIGAVVLFSLCSFSSGLATGFISLLIIRFVMGIFEGPVLPLAQAFMLAQSSPHRRGFNMGFMQTSAVGLISSMLGPIIVVALAAAFSWRVTFFLTIIPGLIIAFLIAKVLEEPVLEKTEEKEQPKEKVRIWDVFKNRNVVISCLFGICILSWYIVMLSFSPLFLTQVKGLTPTQMSFIMSALGVGAIVWGMVVPKLSDHLGRKPMIIIFSLLSIVAPLGFLYANSYAMLALCAFIGWCGAGVFPLFESAVPAESVHPKFASTSIATVQLVGELIGAVGGAAIAGILGDIYGLSAIMWFTTGCMVVGAVIAFGYYETAPLVLAKRRGEAVSEAR